MTTTVVAAPSSTYYGSKLQTEYGNYTIDLTTGLATVDSRSVPALLQAGFSIPATRVLAGSHVITAGEATANAVVIATGLSGLTSKIVQVLTSAHVVGTSDAVITDSAGSITIADGASYNTVAGSIVNWMAIGY